MFILPSPSQISYLWTIKSVIFAVANEYSFTHHNNLQTPACLCFHLFGSQFGVAKPDQIYIYIYIYIYIFRDLYIDWEEKNGKKGSSLLCAFLKKDSHYPWHELLHSFEVCIAIYCWRVGLSQIEWAVTEDVGGVTSQGSQVRLLVLLIRKGGGRLPHLFPTKCDSKPK